MKHALIIGVSGQDGSYLCDILLEQGYLVYGLYRRSSVDNLVRIKHLLSPQHPNLILLQGDLTDTDSIRRAVSKSHPDEVYHVADQDHVGWSFNTPQLSVDITYGGTIAVLEAVRTIWDHARVYIPVSATMFGDADPPQCETTPLNPLSPYAVAKVACYHAANYYRQAYKMCVSTVTLFNHDSIRRGSDYLLHNICKGAVEISLGKKDKLPVGDLSVDLDIGYARDYMEAVVKMMQANYPVDLVLASGHRRSLESICWSALQMAGVNEHPDKVLVHDHSFHRPGSSTLIGDISRAKTLLGFNPESRIPFLVKSLVERYQKELT